MKELVAVILAVVIPLGVHLSADQQRRGGGQSRAGSVSGDQQDPMSIIGGKMLAFAISPVDEAAFTPPGKWVNTYGFTYYRYTERGSGDNKASVNGLRQEMADGAVAVLTASQIRSLVDIVGDQHALEVKAAANREGIIRELFNWRDSGSGDEAAVLSRSTENGHLLAQVLAQRSRVYGEIMLSLTTQQLSDLHRVRNGKHSGVVAKSSAAIRSVDGTPIDKLQMTLLLADFLTWATGTEDMNRVIDPGRPAVFFGFAGLRIADRQSGNPSGGLRRDASRIVLDLLSPAQMAATKDLVKDQAKFLDEYLATQKDIASLIMGYQRAASVVSQADLDALCVQAEVAEGRLGLLQAKRMASIIGTLTPQQRAKLQGFKQ